MILEPVAPSVVMAKSKPEQHGEADEDPVGEGRQVWLRAAYQLGSRRTGGDRQAGGPVVAVVAVEEFERLAGLVRGDEPALGTDADLRDEDRSR